MLGLLILQSVQPCGSVDQIGIFPCYLGPPCKGGLRPQAFSSNCESENQKLKDEVAQLRADVDGLMTQMKLAEDELPSEKDNAEDCKTLQLFC